MKLLLSLLVVVLLSACQREIPEPEVKIELIKTEHEQKKREVPVFFSKQQQDFSLRYYIDGNNVMVECKMPNVSFRDQKAKIRLMIDGKKKQEVASPAFLIKGLSKGEHKIKLEVINENNEVLGTKEFAVNIS